MARRKVPEVETAPELLREPESGCEVFLLKVLLEDTEPVTARPVRF
jgi:hypothetical protein